MKWRSFLTMAVVVVLFMQAASLWASEKEGIAKKAFDLRMEGKADEARALLEKAISEEHGNAAAYYELARTNLHIGLGRPSELIKNFQESIVNPAGKAVEIAPRNAEYASFAAGVAFVNAYISLRKGGAAAKEMVAKMCRAYENLLKIEPESVEPMLCLVEIYAVLPDEMGGDRAKAEDYAKRIEKMDPVSGARARSILLPDDADSVAYWKKVLESHEGNADVLEELGKACLREGKIEEGAKDLDDAMKADSRRGFLLLDLARFHLLRVMQGKGPRDVALAAAEKAIKRYLESDPIPPLKAYAIEMLAKVEFGRKNKKAVDELREKAKAIDPFYSKATGMPSLSLFVSPGGRPPKIHRYLFRPL